ncbi:Rha family transcriptional regulator [Salmonella enterica]|uniref:DNA-binding protein n=1 Tax=Salmonella enterica subsp. enterica serovar Rough O:d:1,7 TaxID=1974323 RepID=A0A974QDQ5_SALET|nr:Rha family transcriptional regulator [Salmonella enterica]ECD7243445.1 DNA-binding protein [Salmonella enterica subsp. enterica serovar Florida]ECF4166528.1 DNA-binding protein [Salmonella enterica subsp. enterica serovar Florida]ECW2474273.1 DNA-binding protein [Salmonella enterica subsp. enterica serovar Florida]EIQ6926156.1 Rha family transcriptional regulator [Salmonella enterica]EJS1431968.1 Rha family transcriptional regulator [Salmonella enterica]
MNNLITNKPSMTSLEIAELVNSRHDSVKRTIERLSDAGIIQLPPSVKVENKQSNSPNRFADGYRFEGENGKRDSIVTVAQLSPEFTARLVDRWKELEEERSRPKSQAELIAEMALLNVEQERRLNHVEEKVVEVVELVDSIARGAAPPGWAGYTELMSRCGMSDKKMRQLVSAFGIESKKIPFIAPGGTKSTMTIVPEKSFMATFRHMMSEAEPRGTRWYHPKMGLFQAIGWRV